MIELHSFPTPNGWKVSIALEELELDYELHAVNISRGEQFEPSFLAISPNNRVPAIVDRDPAGGGEPISVFESGAILLYLAEKTGRLMPADFRRRVGVLDTRLEGREFIADEYSVADIACWPWIALHDHHGVDPVEFPNVERWFGQIGERDAVKRGTGIGLDAIRSGEQTIDDEAKQHLFRRKY
jgi:GST-like protein